MMIQRVFEVPLYKKVQNIYFYKFMKSFTGSVMSGKEPAEADLKEICIKRCVTLLLYYKSETD